VATLDLCSSPVVQQAPCSQCTVRSSASPLHALLRSRGCSKKPASDVHDLFIDRVLNGCSRYANSSTAVHTSLTRQGV
jgi:hypothetical protein